MDTGELIELGSSTLFEATDHPHALDGALRPVWRGAGLAGPALPLRCAPGDNLAIHVALKDAPRDCVLVIDGGGAMFGYWGEVLTEMAQTRGVAGLVIDGAVRDIDAMERRGFPVFARGISVRGTAKVCAPAVNTPLFIADAPVSPDDLIVADTDGVVCVPAAGIDETVASARRRQAKEAEYMAALRGGASTYDLFGLATGR